MGTTIYKVIGKRGRITIPWEIRRKTGIDYNDVVSFETENDTVIIKREKICDGCKSPVLSTARKENSIGIEDLLKELPPRKLQSALIGLLLKWMAMENNRECEVEW